MFKRTILAAVTLSMFAVPMAQAQAQSRHDGPRPNYSHTEKVRPGYYLPKGYKAQKQVPSRHHAQRPGSTRHHWTRGDRIPEWQRRHHVRDYHRHGLRKPAKNQRWVKVDNDYLLISLATGVILGMAAAR